MNKRNLFSLPKVCHITSVHSRYDTRIFQKECKSLANNGYQVTLLVNDKLGAERIDGVNIESTMFEPKFRINRILFSQKKLKKKAISVDAKIYHFHDPELLPLAIKLKKKGKKVIFDFHEDVAKQILYKSWIPKFVRKLVSNIYTAYSNSKIQLFDAVISVTPNLVESLREININTYMITNYPIIKSYTESRLFNENNYICFAGGIDSQWNHKNIISAISRHANTKYIMAGPADNTYLESLKELKGWSKVEYLGKIPFNQVEDVYKNSVIGVALLDYDSQVGLEGTFGNTKIFEFMESGLPIVCSKNRIWSEIVNKYNCGIAVDPNNVEEILNAFSILLNNKELAIQMGSNGRIAVEKEFNWKSQEFKLINLYNNII